MKKIIVALLVFMLMLPTMFCISVLAEGKEEPEIIHSGKYENAYRYNIQGWIYLHIEGEPYERGYQHGYLLAAEIVDHINRWSNVIHNSPPLENRHIDHESARYEKLSNTWWNFCRSRIKRIYWDRTPEEYQEEIKGIADGVKDQGGKIYGRDVDYIDILAINQFFEWMIRNDNTKKGFHPLRDLFNSLKNLIPTSLDEDGFVQSFLDVPPTDHCNAFIATGDATTDGQLVAAHNIRCGGWWYSYYIAQRWNVILDIAPSDGYRLMLHSSPGFIWSDANYYQNEEGIVIMDTTCAQGLWKNKGYSMVIRTRRAAQYSENLDEAIDYLMEKNDGLWTAAYLIGDSETGEIARLDLSLYNYEIWRTFDGFYWSANNIMSTKIRAEAIGLGLKGILYRMLGLSFYGYFTRRYFHTPRDAKFEELGEKYYGDIDIEVLKDKIMCEHPITDSSTTDIKATDTQLMEANSLWAFWGNARGMIWDVSDQEPNLKDARNVPPAGWTLIYGLPTGHDVKLPLNTNEVRRGLYNSKILWEYDFAKDFEGGNSWYANLAYATDIIFGAGLDGTVYALDAETGEKLWIKKVNDYGGITWINTDQELVIVGWENESCALDQITGDVIWTNDDINFISSQPVFINDKVIFGTRNGDLYAVNRADGKIVWHTTLNQQKMYPSVSKNSNSIIVANDKQCYAIDAADGTVKWTFTANEMVLSPPLIIGNTVYFGSCDTNIYALEADTGKLKWKHSTGWGIVTTPAFSDDTVFAGSLDHHMYALKAEDGGLSWSFECNAAIHSPPVVYGEYVFFGCDDGWYYALNKSNGNIAWCFAANNTIDDDIYNYITTAVVGNSLADDGMIFTSANGKIYGFDAQTIEPEVVTEKIDEIPLQTILYIVIILFTAIAIIGAAVYLNKTRKTKK